MRAPKRTISNARHLRRKLSAPEARLWSRLRTRRLASRCSDANIQWDHTCSTFIARKRIAIEIDGISHDMADRGQRDERRDAWLKKHGVTVLGIPATELTRNIDEAADAIVRAATAEVH
jgi:very-short-patch-repair endonuclease